MTDQVFQLLYVSRSAVSTEPGQFEATIRSILAAAARHNRPAAITGALLYDRGRFLQWLEGPRAAVERRYAKIVEDPRHTDLEVVLRQPSPERRFAQWRMAFVNVGQAAIYRLPSLTLSDEPPEHLLAHIEAALADASTLSVAA